MSLFRPDGSYIPWGALERTRVEPFIANPSLPDWLSFSTNDNGTFQLNDPLTTAQRLQLNAPTTAQRYSQLVVNDNRGPSQSVNARYNLDELEVRLAGEGLYCSHNAQSMDFRINVWDTNNGASFACTSEGTYFEARPGGTASRVYLDYDVLQGNEFGKRRNLEFIVRPDRSVLLLENGLLVAQHQFSAAQMALGAAQVRFVVFNRAQGVAAWLRMGQMRLTLCHD